MAFALRRSARILCKLYSVSHVSAAYSTLRPANTRITLIQAVKTYCHNTQSTSSHKITGSLTNIQATTVDSTNKSSTNNNQDETQKEEAERKKHREQSQRMMFYSFAVLGTCLGIGFVYTAYEVSKPRFDENGDLIEDEFAALPFPERLYKRLRKEFNYFKKLVQEPSREKLLPDTLKYPYIQPPYTLVLEMTDLLVHPDWTYQTGWRFKKRPGVDTFLEAIAPPQFEIVVYTAEQGMTVFPILDVLDPNGYIMYRLVRDATRFVDGHHVKDLDALNRDLGKVIVVDWNPESVKFHPQNMLKIPRWTGNDDDTTLYDLAAFLKTIQATNVEDVRDVLNYYRQFDNPLEAFRENQRKLQLQMEETQAQQENKKSTYIKVETIVSSPVVRSIINVIPLTKFEIQ